VKSKSPRRIQPCLKHKKGRRETKILIQIKENPVFISIQSSLAILSFYWLSEPKKKNQWG
jgi:hypothetical protein